MIKFTKIYIEGFGSYITRKKFKLDRPGLNIVIAENGSGKTTTFSALVWAITGTSLKKTKNVSTWPNFRTKDYKGTYVEICFKKDKDKYSVIRLKDYKGVVHGAKGKDRLILVKNGEPLKFLNKKATEKAIFETLGFTEELLLNSVIFGQRMKRLIENTGPEKKRVFEEAFSAGFIQQALERAKEDLKDITLELGPIQNELIVTKERKVNLKALLDNEKENKAKWEKQIEQSIQVHKNSIKDFKKDFKELGNRPEETDIYKVRDEFNALQKTKEQEVEKLKNLQTKHDAQVAEYRLQARSNQEQIKYLMKQNDHLRESSKCSVCGSILSDQAKVEKHIAQHNKQIDAFRTGITDCEAKIEELSNKYRPKKHKIQKNIEAYDKTLKELDNRRAKMVGELWEYDQAIIANKKIEKYIKSAKDKIKQLEAEKYDSSGTKEVRSKYKKTKALYKELKPKFKRLTEEQQNVKWVINDILSNKGLKAFIFDRMLVKLNDKLKYYEQFIGFRVEFRVDLEGGNKDIYAVCFLGKDMVFYEDLSGGEKQKVDAATAFALFDLVSYNRPTNLLVFDEPYESLDSTNAEIISELIQEKAHGKSVFLITHDIQLQNSSTKVIRMSKGKDGDTIHKVL